MKLIDISDATLNSPGDRIGLSFANIRGKIKITICYCEGYWHATSINDAVAQYDIKHKMQTDDIKKLEQWLWSNLGQFSGHEKIRRNILKNCIRVLSKPSK